MCVLKVTTVTNTRGMLAQTVLGWYKYVCSFVVLSSKFRLNYHSSYVQKFSYIWYIKLKLHTKLRNGYYFTVSENTTLLLILKILIISYTVLFFFSETPSTCKSDVNVRHSDYKYTKEKKKLIKVQEITKLNSLHGNVPNLDIMLIQCMALNDSQ